MVLTGAYNLYSKRGLEGLGLSLSRGLIAIRQLWVSDEVETTGTCMGRYAYMNIRMSLNDGHMYAGSCSVELSRQITKVYVRTFVK